MAIAEAWNEDNRPLTVAASATPEDVRKFAKRECERLQKIIATAQEKLDEWKEIADA